MINLEFLPIEILLKLFSYLSYSDIVHLGQTCKRLNEVASEESLWKALSEKYWLHTKKCNEKESWKAHFQHIYHDLGAYIDCYATICGAWNRLKSFLSVHCPQLLTTLNEGASEELLNSVEKKANFPLPKDVRCFYRIHNGQHKDATIGIFGKVTFEDFNRIEVFRDISAFFDPTNRVLSLPYLPISHCRLTNLKMCVALKDDTPPFKQGSVFHLAHQTGIAFNLGSSLTEWFLDYVEKLTSGDFLIKDKVIYRFSGSQHCKATTGYITVRVSTAFLPEITYTHPYFYSFAYHITMEMDPNAPRSQSCQLLTRHWTICNRRGEEEPVYGSGVVGEYPVMKPGASYSWSSCTQIKTRIGCMYGTFSMKNLITQKTLVVECPRFNLQGPRRMQLYQRKLPFTCKTVPWFPRNPTFSEMEDDSSSSSSFSFSSSSSTSEDDN